MAKYTIDIPEELVPYMTDNLPSVPAYIRAVLLKPLLVRYEADERARILKTPIDELTEKLSNLEKDAKIKKEKKSFDDSALEEAKDLPSTETPAPVAPTPEPAPSVIVETIPIPTPEPVVETPTEETPVTTPPEEPTPQEAPTA